MSYTSRRIENEPSLPSASVEEWTRRRDLMRPAPERNRTVEKEKRGPIGRAWDAIPRPVKIIGGAILIGLGLQYFFKYMADQHAIIGKRTNEVAKGVSGATKATDPVSGLTGRGSVVSNPGDGVVDMKPGISGSTDRAVPRLPGEDK